MTPSLILLGASTRAAAWSAVRAGLPPLCADLFADADLRRLCPVRQIPPESYPAGLLDALADAPPGPIVYTGALENRPDLIARLRPPVWGNDATAVRMARDPSYLAHCLTREAVPCPAVRTDAPTTGRWLVKPRRGAGGSGIRVHAGEPIDPRTHYLQEWIDGRPCAGIFLGRPGGGADLLGVTRQRVGVPWLHAGPFQYAGSVGPLSLEEPTRRRWRAIGTAIARGCDLRGLFGVDAVERDGVPWPVEVNPRYTASVEILERGLGVPLLALHRAVFEHQPVPRLPPVRPGVMFGKAVYYAPHDLVVPGDGPWMKTLRRPLDPDHAEYADLPHPGDVIPRGRPVLTVFADGPDEAACVARLQETAAALDRHFARR